MAKTVLVCGASGQLGSSLIKIFSGNPEYNVYGLSRKFGKDNGFECDITDYKNVEKVFNSLNPDIVINTAACGNADYCERNKEYAYKVNFNGNCNILDLSKINKSSFVFISSYYIFDGTKKNYNEDSIPAPLNYYGVTKLISEIYTRKYKNSLVIRASKIFSLGYDNRNLLARLYLSLINEKEFPAANDQFNNPIHADFLSRSIIGLVSSGTSGIYNVGGDDYVSNYELAKSFADYFKFDSSLIKPVNTKESRLTAKRPKHVFLDTKKLKSTGIETYKLINMFKTMQDKIENG
jgi:dTDP-4-dehydrorhamnose reductase